MEVKFYFFIQIKVSGIFQRRMFRSLIDGMLEYFTDDPEVFLPGLHHKREIDISTGLEVGGTVAAFLNLSHTASFEIDISTGLEVGGTVAAFLNLGSFCPI